MATPCTQVHLAVTHPSKVTSTQAPYQITHQDAPVG